MSPVEFATISPLLPREPGIYKYFDSFGKLIYVGKAKHIRKRVSSYFTGNQASNKTKELVRKIHRIEFTIVNNEQDAFFLENTLIKEYQPQYNISLKDDKTYPYIVIKNEPFPRVFFTRKKISDGSEYLGPYTSVQKVRELLEFIKQTIPLRTCKLNLSAANINKGKYKVCLEYHLGNCNGPCTGLQSTENYREGIEHLKQLLKGNLKPVIQTFKKQQQASIDRLEFEAAARFQEKIDFLKQYHAKSVVVNTNTGLLDVFSILDEADTAFVNYLALNHGSIFQTKTIAIEKKLDEAIADLLVFAIARLRELYRSEAPELILPFSINYPDKNLKITVPIRGSKKDLLDLSLKNVNFFKADMLLKKHLLGPEHYPGKDLEILEEIQKVLQLPELPVHIECFDNSNLHGTNPVAAMVCFKNGQASKKDFRHFHIKTVQGINDFASMKEVVLRRYKRLLETNEAIPQLVIIDGGKGQLSAAMDSITELGLAGKLTLVGLAKNKEELFFTGDKESILLPWNSDSLKLIRRIRDEVHRFGLEFHRNLRSHTAIDNSLEKIHGIGKQTRELLLSRFKSVHKIKLQSEENLSELIGKSKAAMLYRALHETNSNA